MPGRNSQVIRIYSILSLLDGVRNGLTVAEITDKINEHGHSATRRTIYRDLEVLLASGFPLKGDGELAENNSSRWFLESHARINDHFVLSARELLAQYFAKGTLAPLKDTPFFPDLTSVFSKIESRLGSRGREHLAELHEEFRFESGPRWGLGIDPDVLETVRASCAEKHVVKVQYLSASKQQKKLRTLGPHYLYYAKGSLYLVAEDLEDKRVKVFAVPRMTNAVMHDELYGGQVTDPGEYFRDSFGVFRGGELMSAKIEIGPVLASYIKERQWHDSQRIVLKSDGSLILSLQVTNTPEFVQWILGLGIHARVLEPSTLRDGVMIAARTILDGYEGKAA